MTKRKSSKKKSAESKQTSLFDSKTATSHKAQVEFVSTEKREDTQYGGIGIKGLVEIFKQMTDDRGGKYTAFEWNGSAMITFECNDMVDVKNFMNRLDLLSKEHRFRAVMTLHFFADDVFGYRYQVNAKVPGILVVSSM